ncbi:MAG TPA: Ppx/GppA phosphatase family protein [Candidatus Angelobacter sp.]|nr:Ppx/GppA phosphatase family protein [Candidatus Angelobacter sp.]
MRLGVLDVGSNTVHLLVVDAHHGAAPVPAHSHKTGMRLAELIGDGERFSRSGIDTLVSFVHSAQQVAEDFGVTEMMAFATSAIREAANGEDVLREVRERTGADLQVLSGEDEARLTFLAVRRWYGWSSGRLLVLDIGGGSLEIAVGADEVPDVAVSVPLGAGRLTRTFLARDPARPDDVRAARKHARATIADVAGRVARAGEPRHVVATSKTFRSLARIAGAAPSSDGPFVRRHLDRQDLRSWVPKLAAMSARERADLSGVSSGRAPQVLAGAIVAEAAMDLLGVERLEIAPWALREGVILERLDRMGR